MNRPLQKIPKEKNKTNVIYLITMILVNMLSDTTTEETEINKLVYQLYDLTPEQIKIIEES